MKQFKLMTVLVLMIILNTGVLECKAQTWDELFRQKEIQREYLILQIGALEIQSKLLTESASIFQFGLDAIGNWKGLEKHIHTVFFDSFKKLGPISRAEYQRSIGLELSPELLLARIVSSNSHWQGESLDLDFLEMNRAIHEGLRRRCLGTMEELMLILENELELKDDDRAKLIAKAGSELNMIQKDLMRLQIWSAHRMQMNAQKAEWQKDLSRY